MKPHDITPDLTSLGHYMETGRHASRLGPIIRAILVSAASCVALWANPTAVAASERSTATPLTPLEVVGDPLPRTPPRAHNPWQRPIMIGRWAPISTGPTSGYDTDVIYDEPAPENVQEFRNDCAINNPILAGSGVKVQLDRDFGGEGEMALGLTRRYSSAATDTHMNAFGHSWTSNLEFGLARGTNFPDECRATLTFPANNCLSSPHLIEVTLNFGERHVYSKENSTTWRRTGDPFTWVTRDTSTGRYTLNRADDSRAVFRPDGRIHQVQDSVGNSWSYTYEPLAGGERIRVTRSGGRSIELTVGTDRRVTKVKAPNGAEYDYTYSQGRLSKVTYPGGANDAREYGYTTGRLTSIRLGGELYAEFDYHGGDQWAPNYGRGKLTTRPDGIEQATLEYRTEWDQTHGDVRVTEVTNSLGAVTEYRFRSDNKLISVDRQGTTYCPTSTATRSYDSNGRLQATTDWNGVRTTYKYTTAGQLEERVEGIDATKSPYGLRYEVLSWDNKNRIHKRVEGLIDAAGVRTRLSTTDYVFGASTTATASTAGDVTNRLKQVTLTSHLHSLRAETTNYLYKLDEYGRVSSASVDPPAGGRTEFAYSTEGDLLSVTNVLGHTTSFSEYTLLGQPQLITDPNNDRLRYELDARGRIKSLIEYHNGQPKSTTFEYNRFGKVSRVHEVGQPERRNSYDAAGRLTTSESRVYLGVNPLRYESHQEHHIYNTESHPTERSLSFVSYQAETQVCHTTPGGWQACSTTPEWACTFPREMHYSHYDGIGRLRHVSSNVQPGSLASHSEPQPQSMCPTYPVSEGPRTTFGYSANGQITSVTDGLNHETTYEYDALGRPTKITDASQKTTTIQYRINAGAFEVQVAPPSGSAFVDRYDGFGRLVYRQVPGAAVTTLTYKLNGLLDTVQPGDGSFLTYDHDALGRVKSVTTGKLTPSMEFGHTLAEIVGDPPRFISPITRPPVPGATTQQSPPDRNVISYEYDTCGRGKGRLCQAINGSSYWHTLYTYGNYGRITSREEFRFDNSLRSSVAYHYDHLGRAAGITYPNLNHLTYTYLHGRVDSVTLNVNGTHRTIAKDIRYRPDGTVSGYTFGNGITRQIGRDLAGRVISLRADSHQHLSFEYDDAHRITNINDAINQVGDTTLEYDALSRLTKARRADRIDEWALNPVGHRLNSKLNFVQTTHTLNLDRLTRLSGPLNRNYRNDVRGQREVQFEGSPNSVRAQRHVFDAFGNQRWVLRSFDIGDVCEPTTHIDCDYREALAVDYGTNFRQQRTYKALKKFTTTRIYPELTEPCPTDRYEDNCLPIDAYDVEVFSFMYDEGSALLSEVRATPADGATITNYIWLGGEPIGMVRDNAVYFVINDHLGRPERVTDSTKAVVWQARNLAFHREVAYAAKHFGNLNLGFPGQYYDNESNLYYNWHRYYDPSTGRYTQSDPIGLAGGINTFAYANSNPSMNIDPDGLDWQVSFNVSGSILAGIPQFGFTGLGLGGGAGVGISIPSNLRNWRCYQIFGQSQANGMGAVGGFVGIGFAGGISHSDGPLPSGIQVSRGIHGEGNVGVGVAAGLAFSGQDGTSPFRPDDWLTPIKGASGTVFPKLGWGGGIGVGVGKYQSVSWATPTIGDSCSCK